MRKKQPMQPVVWDGKGVIRFQKNQIVDHLLEHGGLNLNDLASACRDAPAADWDQFNQLIGYSVSGCPYRSDSIADEADERAGKLLEKYPTDPAQPNGDVSPEKP